MALAGFGKPVYLDKFYEIIKVNDDGSFRMNVKYFGFIQGDVRDVQKMLDRPPDVVKMLGICEYLTDEQIIGIAKAVAAVMPAKSAIVFNSISTRHGTDRFFRRVFGLHMAHRSPQQLSELMATAGFGEFQPLQEPLGVYHVIVGRRLGGA